MSKYTKITLRAGNLVIVRLYPTNHKSDTQQVRQWKQALRSKANRPKSMKTATFKMRVLVAANFNRGDTFATLTFSDEWLPRYSDDKKNRKAIKKMVNYYLRKLRKALPEWRGQALKYIYVIEGKHGAGRYHVHMISNIPMQHMHDAIALWPYGTANNQDFRPVRLEPYDDNPDALYMVKEGSDRPLDAHLWHKSRNVVFPHETREQVPDTYKISDHLPADAQLEPGCECYELPITGLRYEIYFYAVPDTMPDGPERPALESPD